MLRFLNGICYAAGLLLAGGCGLFDDIPDGGQLIQPPAIYKRWWQQVEACSGKQRDFREVRWYRVEGASFVRENGHRVGGFYSPGDNYIVLSDTSASNSSAVRHEMLHALLDARGHSREYFLGVCASVVDCPDSCVEDAGPWTSQPGSAALAAESLRVATFVELLPPTEDGQRWLTIRVTVENPRPNPIVAVPIGMPFAFNVSIASFGGGTEYNMTVRDPSSLAFGPSQRKEKVYDFLVADSFGSYAVPQGTYLIEGGFGQHFGPAQEVVVAR